MIVEAKTPFRAFPVTRQVSAQIHVSTSHPGRVGGWRGPHPHQTRPLFEPGPAPCVKASPPLGWPLPRRWPNFAGRNGPRWPGPWDANAQNLYVECFRPGLEATSIAGGRGAIFLTALGRLAKADRANRPPGLGDWVFISGTQKTKTLTCPG